MTDKKMKKLVVLLLFSICFSCGRDRAEKPEHLLTEEEIVNIMYDLSLLQAMSSAAQVEMDSAKIDPSKYIFKKYKIDSLTLAQNEKYYANDMEKYQKLHIKVSDKLAAQKAPLDSLAKKQGSAKKINFTKKRLTPAAK